VGPQSKRVGKVNFFPHSNIAQRRLRLNSKSLLAIAISSLLLFFFLSHSLLWYTTLTLSRGIPLVFPHHREPRWSLATVQHSVAMSNSSAFHTLQTAPKHTSQPAIPSLSLPLALMTPSSYAGPGGLANNVANCESGIRLPMGNRIVKWSQFSRRKVTAVNLNTL
jgi:hypothetical protein